MTEDEVLRLARESGMPVTDYGSGPFIDDGVTTEMLERFATLCHKSLVAALSELERDAARYQWFAGIAVNGEFDKAEKAFARFGDAESCTKEELDAAIDLAMGEQK